MIKPLTSLRFFAALAVVYDHLGTGSHTGGLGVIFFFLLSGFIIAFTYSSKTMNLSFSVLGGIYTSRFGRIFPLHLFTLALALPLSSLSPAPSDASAFITNALLVHSWYPSELDYFSYNSVSWTLSIEWAFYLTFPLLLHYIKSSGMDRSALSLVGLFLAPIAVLMAFSLILFQKIDGFNYYWWLLKISPLNALMFVSGAAIGLNHIRSREADVSRPIATALEIASIAGIAAIYYALVIRGEGKALPFDYTLLFVPAFSLCIYSFAFSRGLLSSALSWGPLVKLGELSFSIYMLHMIIIRYADAYVMTVSGQSATLQAKLATVMITIVASYFAYSLVESPCRSASKVLGRKLFSRGSSEATTLKNNQGT